MLSAEEALAIEQRVERLEASTGAEVVAAIVPRSDRYPEVPWRAFAIGAAFAALMSVVADRVDPGWASLPADSVRLAQSLLILGGGALSALASLAMPAYARALVPAARLAGEVRQCAEAMFVERRLSATARRNVVLVLVSVFERRVVVVPDVAYRDRIATDDWQAVVDAMTPHLGGRRFVQAFLDGFAAVERVLVDKGFAGGAGGNVVPDALVRGSAP